MSAMRNLILKKWLVAFLPAALLSLFLVGCGFHLQGSRPLPAALQKLSIEFKQSYGVAEPPLLKFLQAEAERRGGWVVAQRQDDAARLRITSLENKRQALSLSPETGKTIESLLTTTVEYELVKGSDVLVPQQSDEVVREIIYNPLQVLSKEYEDQDAYEEMQRELARIIYLRLEGRLAAQASSAR